jgi:hypothetical protein
MSPDLLQKILATAPPGCTIEIVSISIPEATSSVTSMRQADAAPAPDAWTAEAVVERVRREHGDHGLKLKEWAGMLPGISHRELMRATRDGRLIYYYKTSGRDHRARMASSDAMLAFLASHPAGTEL